MMTLDSSLTRLYRVNIGNANFVLGIYSHSESTEDGVGVLAENAGVASNTNLIGGLGDSTTHNDNFGGIARDSRGEGSVGGNCSGSSTSTSGGAAILASIASSSL